MPLRARLQHEPETVQDFEIASDEKYWEGIELLAAGRPGAGIYLMGYVGEMLLKIACFRFDGAQPYDLVAPRLAPSRSWAKVHLHRTDDERYHSLLFWVQVLRTKRALAGRSLPPPVDSRLLQRTRRMYQIWWVQMRYRPDQALPREADTMYDDVTWIRDNRIRLWT